MSEGYPENWKHAVVHFNPETKSIHFDRHFDSRSDEDIEIISGYWEGLKSENKRLEQRINLLQIAGDEAIKQRNDALRERDEARAEVERLEKREKLNIAGSETYKLLCERTKELERLREAYKTARQEMCNIVKIAKKEGLIEIIEDTFEQILDEALEGGGD